MNTKAKHSPGPWVVNDQQHHSLQIQPAGHPDIIARIVSPEVADSRYYDARIIVAAHELLAALEFAAHYLEHPDIMPASATLERARAAIARAKG